MQRGKTIKRLLVTWFGCGYLRPAPGTWGSLGAVVPAVLFWSAWKLIDGHPMPAIWQTNTLIIFSLLAFIVGVMLGKWAIRFFTDFPPPASFGKKTPQEAAKDPSAFVLDEVAGQWLALAFVPASTWGQLAINCTLAFVFFRIFDVVKLPPVGWLERLPAGWGICADDIAAGVYAGLCSVGVVWLAGW
jgi:phosphatidylglycerophosphatase A